MSDEVKRRSGRLGGRAARHQKRMSPIKQFDPCPPGPIGGQYRPLKDAELRSIVDTAFRILAEIGMGEVPPMLQAKALEKGASLSSTGRLLFSRSMVEDIVAGACKSFVFHGREAKYDLEVGGERVYFGTGGAAVRTLDSASGKYRPSTLRDLYDFTRLADGLDNVSWFTRCCVATDIEDIYELDVNTVYALLAGTKKPIGTSFTLGRHVKPIAQMFDWALGGEGRFKQRPVLQSSYFARRFTACVTAKMRSRWHWLRLRLACRSMRLSPLNPGATAPAAPAGMLAHTTAETLAGLTMVNLFAPGYPMIFSNWPFVVDLRTGSFAGSGGEISLMNAAAAQISNHLGLPSGVASSMADAKAVDAQMGSEKALAALTAGLSGANLVYESSGMMASLLGVSFEAFRDRR